MCFLHSDDNTINKKGDYKHSNCIENSLQNWACRVVAMSFSMVTVFKSRAYRLSTYQQVAVVLVVVFVVNLSGNNSSVFIFKT